MFVCEDCHKNTKCTNGFIEGLMGSYGPCEHCHKVKGCLDCYGYKNVGK